jgi:hypothetical protein
MTGAEQRRSERRPDAGSDAREVPDIQVGRKALAALAVGVVACAFATGYALARRGPRPVEAAPVSRPVEIRIDPATVKLADTALELKTLPPPPEQALEPDGEKP